MPTKYEVVKSPYKVEFSVLESANTYNTTVFGGTGTVNTVNYSDPPTNTVDINRTKIEARRLFGMELIESFLAKLYFDSLTDDNVKTVSELLASFFDQLVQGNTKVAKVTINGINTTDLFTTSRKAFLMDELDAYHAGET